MVYVFTFKSAFCKVNTEPIIVGGQRISVQTSVPTFFVFHNFFYQFPEFVEDVNIRKSIPLLYEFILLWAIATKIKKNSRVGVNPEGLGVNPESLGINPEGLGVNPESLGINPESLGIYPESLGINPESLGINPESLGIIPKALKKALAL